MASIKVAEFFFLISIQGEGRYMGVPSVFLRTFGCNFTCSGFGMEPGCRSNEVEFIDPKQYRTYQELPLVSTGCDSFGSWHPKFKQLSPMIGTTELAEKIVMLLPGMEWKDEHLVITGGEPLLGWQRAYPALLEHPVMKALKELTFETNGTQPLTAEFKEYLKGWRAARYPHAGGEITFSVSAKLSCSGESRENAIKPEIVCEYQNYGYTYLKFVVANEMDAAEAVEVTQLYRNAGFTGPVYLMPVGGVESVYSMNNRKVAEFAMKNGFRYSDRLHVPLFKNAHGT